MRSGWMVRSAILGVVLGASGAVAQSTTELAPTPNVTWSPWDSAPAPQPLWEVRFDPEIWYAAPAGEVKLPGSPASGGKTDLMDLNLDSPRLSPAGTLAFRRGPWRVAFDGSSVAAEGGATMTESGQIGGVPFATGDRLESSIRITTLELTGGYRLFEARRGQWGPDASRLVFGVDAFAGLRVMQFDLDVSGPSGTTGTDEWFGEPVIGGDMEIDLWNQVSVDLKIEGGAAGGYDDKTIGSGAIEVGVSWRPWTNVGVKVGYRLEAFGLSQGSGNDELSFRGSTAGLEFGVTLRF